MPDFSGPPDTHCGYVPSGFSSMSTIGVMGCI